MSFLCIFIRTRILCTQCVVSPPCQSPAASCRKTRWIRSYSSAASRVTHVLDKLPYNSGLHVIRLSLPPSLSGFHPCHRSTRRRAHCSRGRHHISLVLARWNVPQTVSSTIITMATEYPPQVDQYGRQPHPYLHEPVLYISGLPPHVADQDLAAAFVLCAPFRPNIPRDGTNRPLSGTIEFRYMEKGSVAHAVLIRRHTY